MYDGILKDMGKFQPNVETIKDIKQSVKGFFLNDAEGDGISKQDFMKILGGAQQHN